MLPDGLSAEDEQRCRQLLARTTARLRSRPAAAAVLVPLCLVRGVPALLYTLRSSRLVGRHKGEVSFPGGKCDPDDQDIIHTALRETQEELGLEVPKEHVWGVLQPVYDREKATIVPVLANVGPLDLQSLRPNPDEVDEVFEMSLAHLLQTQNQGYTHFCQGGHFSYTLPVFLHGPHRVWGLTAVITELTLKVGASLSPYVWTTMACAGPASGRQRVSMQEHMAIDVSPGPIRPIRLISNYFPHFYPFLEPVLRAPDRQAMLAPAIPSAPQLQPNPEPEGDSDDSTALGTLEFTLLFDEDNSALHCTAHRAKGLKPPAAGSVDTYVKANLLPGASKASQLRTRTVRGTREPVWEETLTYHGFTCQDAGRKTLRLCVCEDSRLRRRRRAPPLGELRVPLRKLVPNRARSFDICLEKRKLTKRPKSLDTARGMSLYEEEMEAEVFGEERGRILLSLCYSSERGGLLVGVLRCAHLAPMDANGYSDPFVRLFLHPSSGKKSKYKTSVRRKTLNPEFNEEFFYAGHREELAQKALLVSVWDYDLGTADDFIGGVQLSGRASGERLRHWRECLGHCDHRLELWHLLDSVPPQLGD